MKRPLFMESVKLPSVLLLTSLLGGAMGGSKSWASVNLAVQAPKVEDRLGRQNLAELIEQEVFKALADESQALLADSRSKNAIEMDLVLKRDLRFPDREAIQCTFTERGQGPKTFVLTYDPEHLQRYGAPWVAANSARVLVERLISHSSEEATLSSDMNDNIQSLRHAPQNKKNPLTVDVMGHRRKLPSRLPRQKVEAIQKQQLPIAERKQKPIANTVLSFEESPVALVEDPTNPIPIEQPYPRQPLNPHEDLSVSGLQRWQTAQYPRFFTAGPISAFMTPMLQLPEAAAGKRFELSFATTQTHATLNDTGGAFTKLAWNGTTTKQTVTVASRLWNRFHLSIESGYGGHKGDIEFEVDQGAARGGTTFLMSGSSDAGMLDTQINLHTVIESGRFLIRPHLRLKLPTGDQEQLLSNGGIDAGFGTSFETLFKGWNINTQISYIQPADLDFFDAGQTSLASKNYVYMGLGLGHQLWDENTRVAFALNWMSHPLQGTTDLSTLDQPLSTLAMQVGQNFSYGHASVDVSSGITASSPRISVGLNLKVWF